MKTIAVVAGLILCGSALLAQGAQPDLGKPITLNEALEIALRQSPEIRSALHQIAKSRAGVAEARANFNPRFNAQVTHTRQGPQVKISIPNLGTANLVKEQSTAVSGSVYLPLDVNKKLEFVSEISRIQFEIDYLALTKTVERVIFDVKSAYYNLLRAEGLAEVAQASVEAASARLKDANALVAQGAAPKFDAMRAEVDVANLNQRLIAARNAVSIARAALNRTLGIDVNLPTSVERIQASIDKNIKIDIPSFVEQAYTNRPEVAQANAALKLARRNVRLQRADLYPSLDLTGSYNHQLEPSGFSQEKDSWAALLTLRIPVWNGGVTKARIEQAQADASKALDGLEQLKLGVAFEVRAAALNLQEAIERVSTTAANVALAEEALRLARVRYNSEISTLVEISDAESALAEARFNNVQATYDTAIAQAELQRATGSQPEKNLVELLQPAAE